MNEGAGKAQIHLRAGDVGLVFVGGTLGVFARELLAFAVPDAGGLPVAVFIANMVGALLLGCLIETLEATRETRRTHRMRLLVGAGVLGGFTTYSALALGITLLFEGGNWVVAAAYALVTVVGGALATWCGMVIASWITRAGSGEARDE